MAFQPPASQVLRSSLNARAKCTCGGGGRPQLHECIFLWACEEFLKPPLPLPHELGVAVPRRPGLDQVWSGQMGEWEAASIFFRVSSRISRTSLIIIKPTSINYLSLKPSLNNSVFTHLLNIKRDRGQAGLKGERGP